MISMINLRINTIIRLTNFTTALAWELYKHKVKKLFQKSEMTFGSVVHVSHGKKL